MYTSRKLAVLEGGRYKLSVVATVIPDTKEDEKEDVPMAITSSPLNMPILILDLPQGEAQTGQPENTAKLRVNTLSVIPLVSALAKNKAENEEKAQSLVLKSEQVLVEVAYLDTLGETYKVEHLRTTQKALTSWENMELEIEPEQSGSVEFSITYPIGGGTPFIGRICWQEVPYTYAKVVQENHYYPFGMNLKGIEQEPSSPNRFQFNAQTEKESSLGLEWYETPFRRYDAQLGRLHGVDALAESYMSNTPFHYSLNNPISMNDPSGLLAKSWMPDSWSTRPWDNMSTGTASRYVRTKDGKDKWNRPPRNSGFTDAQWSKLKTIHSGEKNRMRTTYKVAKKLRRANGDWSRVRFRTVDELNVAFDLAVNLPLRLFMEDGVGNPDLEQIASDQEILEDKYYDSGMGDDGYSLDDCNGLRKVFDIQTSTLQGNVTRQLTGQGDNFRRIYINNVITGVANTAGINPNSILSSTISLDSDTDGIVTYVGYESGLTSDPLIPGTIPAIPGSGATFSRMSINAGTSLDLTGQPYSSRNPMPNSGFTLMHSVPEAALRVRITLTYFEVIQINK